MLLQSVQPSKHILHKIVVFVNSFNVNHHFEMYIHRNLSIPHYKQTFVFEFVSSMNAYNQDLRNHRKLLYTKMILCDNEGIPQQEQSITPSGDALMNAHSDLLQTHSWLPGGRCV